MITFQQNIAKNVIMRHLTPNTPDPKYTFERVRSTVLSGAAIQQQSISSNARHAALDLLFGHPADTHRLLPEIYEKLTPEEVCAVARKVFAVEPTVSVITGKP